MVFTHQLHDNGAILMGAYRYFLWRTWDEARPRQMWVLLIPSTAGHQTDAPIVQTKQAPAEQTAKASNMSYRLIRGTDAEAGHYAAIWDDSLQDTYLDRPPITTELPVSPGN
ncbi:MAG: hypothetical protein OJF49_003248 [Ktedonobacterales bacterium]|jgi:hypothetical protein|nr:MAG: hypothetical protein OJF49_003248 [Ktedonobacterales bacterium]